MSSENTGFEVAIVGMAGRFPGSKNVEELWENICEGKNLITHFTDDELLENGIPKNFIDDPNYVKARGIIDNADEFDASLFNFFPKEVEILDPQQRLFLECSWEAMEDAGFTPDGYNGLVGVFGGIGMNSYVLQYLKANPDLVTSAEGYQLSIGNDKDFLTTRVSYKLNLKGPSIDVQTACSTSLVAIHIACMNLINYQCDLAIAGGSTITLPQKSGYHYQEGMILSPDGVCRPFDKDAGGTVGSNGVGIVVLKRLQDAIDDNDDIYSVIKGSAYNNDGAIKVGYTAPGVNGQTDVIASAFGMADVPMSSIEYIETHGTGTSLGDPIEIEALTQAFRLETNKKQFCAIGSVKSNLGHLDTAAGVTGLIKAALCIYNGKIPPSINFSEPNSKIDFSNSPFYVNTQLKHWGESKIRRAAVSSFGIGGTNAHVVLEQCTDNKTKSQKEDYVILPFSAKTEKSLLQYQNNFRDYLKTNNKLDLRNTAYTLQTGRKELEKRQIVVTSNLNELLDIFDKNLSKKIIRNEGSIIDNPSIIFMFSGQGSQYVNMCRDLYENDEKFRSSLDECFRLLEQNNDLNLKEIIFPDTDESKVLQEKLKQTEFTQPALFVIEYSIAKMLIDYGIKPTGMVGHSIGEFVAACIAGVMDLESALKLVTLRGSLMQKVKKGSMLSVLLPESELKQILPNELDLAVINAHNLCVVSGEIENISEFEKYLIEKNIDNTILHTSHAFHSRMMDPILEEFKSILQTVRFNPPVIPYMSNVTGDFISDKDAVNPNYYVNHLRYTVRFSENILHLMDDKSAVFIEVGPGTTLSSLAKLNCKDQTKVFINTVKHPNQNLNDREIFLVALGKLWLHGVKIDWNNFYDEKPHRVHLPTYAFDKKRYWLKIKNKSANKSTNYRNINDLNSWLYQTSWKRERLKSNHLDNLAGKKIILFDNEFFPLSGTIKEKISVDNLVIVDSGKNFKRVDNNNYKIAPGSINDLESLFTELEKNNFDYDTIIQNWSTCNYSSSENKEFFEQSQNLGFLSVTDIGKVLSKINTKKVTLNIITSNIFDVLGNEKIIPFRSTIIGAAKVISQELTNVATKIIDVDCIVDEKLRSNLLSDIFIQSDSIAVAYRNNYRWVQLYEPLELSKEVEDKYLAKNKVYIITGGLGRIGLSFAENLIRKYNAKVILIDRFELPIHAEWKNYFKELNESDKLFPVIKKLIQLNASELNTEIIKADVSNLNSIGEAIKSANAKFEKIDGVIHAAGLIGDETFQLVNQFDNSNFYKQVKSKIEGTINLFESIKHLELDFVLIQSSLSSILGGIGFSSYSAVNNFVDSFALRKSREKINVSKVISVNWDAWNFSENANGSKNVGIKPSQGFEILEKILTRNSPNQIVISINDLNESIEKHIISHQQFQLVETSEELHDLHERPELDTVYIEPESELEKEIQKEWKNLLGIEKIGMNDNFFELGGNSLIGTQLVSRIRKTFNSEIPLVAVFENATIRGIAKLIGENYDSSGDSRKVSDVMDLVSNMSDEEVAKILKNKT